MWTPGKLWKVPNWGGGPLYCLKEVFVAWFFGWGAVCALKKFELKEDWHKNVNSPINLGLWTVLVPHACIHNPVCSVLQLWACFLKWPLHSSVGLYTGWNSCMEFTLSSPPPLIEAQLMSHFSHLSWSSLFVCASSFHKLPFFNIHFLSFEFHILSLPPALPHPPRTQAIWCPSSILHKLSPTDICLHVVFLLPLPVIVSCLRVEIVFHLSSWASSTWHVAS